MLVGLNGLNTRMVLLLVIVHMGITFQWVQFAKYG